jgi:hypothetical protein
MSYLDFIASKQRNAPARGFAPHKIEAPLFGYQKDVVRWQVEQGRAASFLDTGLGKSICQLEWSRQCALETGRPALLLTPLAVGHQMVREAERFGIPARMIRQQSDVADGINVINYHRLDDIDVRVFGSVSLDESSILKSFTGSTKRMLCQRFADTPYRLCNTATPAPNDYMELGNHSEFLGVMPGSEMLSRWFIVDTMDMGKYRIKGHGVEPFWSWVSSWAVCAMHPSDLGHPEEDFQLPPLTIKIEEIEDSHDPGTNGALFADIAVSATELGGIKRRTLTERIRRTVELAESMEGPVLIWCQTNDESAALGRALREAVEVRGSHTPEEKEDRLLGFADGRYRMLVTKPSIAGFGLNWQHCSDVIFASVNYSYEQFYQAIRRCWRFGQTREVFAHIIASQSEGRLIETIMRKKADHDAMKAYMRSANFARREALVESVKKRYSGSQMIQVPAFLGGGDS